MESSVSLMENLSESVEAYSRTTFELAKLKALQMTSDAASSLMSRLSVVLAVSLFALVFNIGIALWLGDFWGKTYYGFFIVAAFYLVAAVLLHFSLLTWTRKAIGDIIITEAFDNDKITQTIHSSTELNTAIFQLENQRATEEKAMKADFHLAYESVKPINLIKSTFQEVMEAQDLSNNIISTTAGLTAGYLSKKLFVGVSSNPYKKLIGHLLMFGVTNLVAKHPETVKSVGSGILNLIQSIPWDGIHHTKKNGLEDNDQH